MISDDGFENSRTLFAADLLREPEALEAPLRDADREKAEAIAHGIYGTATSFGCPEISGPAVVLQVSANDDSPARSSGLVKKISGLTVH